MGLKRTADIMQYVILYISHKWSFNVCTGALRKRVACRRGWVSRILHYLREVAPRRTVSRSLRWRSARAETSNVCAGNDLNGVLLI